jgi:hypothetical protein
MLRLLTAIPVLLSVVVLAQAQTVAPGPAAPGGPNPYGIGPGGIPIAPGSGESTAPAAGERSTAPSTVTPDTSSERREVRRHTAKRPRAANAGTSFAPRGASAGHRRCWRCGRYGWAYSGGYYLWPAPYYAGGSERRFYDNYVRYGWGPPYVGGYLAEIVTFRVNGR